MCVLLDGDIIIEHCINVEVPPQLPGEAAAARRVGGGGGAALQLRHAAAAGVAEPRPVPGHRGHHRRGRGNHGAGQPRKPPAGPRLRQQVR